MSLQQNIKLKKGFGYKCKDVDEFIDRALEALSAQTAKSDELGSALTLVRKELLALQESEQQRIKDFTTVLSVANKSAEQIIEDAHQKAKEIETAAHNLFAQAQEHVKEAGAAAAGIISDAEIQADEIIRQANENIRETQALYIKLREMSNISKTYLHRMFENIEKIDEQASDRLSAMENMRLLPEKKVE